MRERALLPRRLDRADPLTGAGDAPEALVRWHHATHGAISPVEIIPVAEQSGLIVQLGSWVLRTACTQTARWQTEHPQHSDLTISVNLAPRQLAEPDLLTTVVNTPRDSGLTAASLCLEITRDPSFATSRPAS